MVQEIGDELKVGGPMRAMAHLRQSHNILSLEAKSILKLAAQQIKEIYGLISQEEMKSIFAFKIDSLIEEAHKEFRLSVEVSALKLGCMLHGLIDNNSKSSMEDIMDSIAEPRELSDIEIHAIASPDLDPLRLAQEE
jgi:hypothetical protein